VVGVGSYTEVSEIVQCRDEQVVALGVLNITREVLYDPNVSEAAFGHFDKSIELAKVGSGAERLGWQPVYS
jgi:hypothetical protein